jgi:hypothetical protein
MNSILINVPNFNPFSSEFNLKNKLAYFISVSWLLIVSLLKNCESLNFQKMGGQFIVTYIIKFRWCSHQQQYVSCS